MYRSCESSFGRALLLIFWSPIAVYDAQSAQCAPIKVWWSAVVCPQSFLLKQHFSDLAGCWAMLSWSSDPLIPIAVWFDPSLSVLDPIKPGQSDTISSNTIYTLQSHIGKGQRWHVAICQEILLPKLALCVSPVRKWVCNPDKADISGL